MIDNAVAIICSRPESKRLPGKVFKKIAGRIALNHIIDRISRHIPVCVAIPEDIEVTDESNYKDCSLSIQDGYFFHGSNDSPLHRMEQFLLSGICHSRWICRITHDDLLIDAQTMIDLIAECEKQNAGYGITPSIVEGAGVEVIHRENLMRAAETHKEPTEYVSYFVRGEGMPFPKIVKMEPRESIKRSYRLTMDYPEDAQVLDIVLRQVGAFASTDAICEFIDKHPYIMNINRQPEVTLYTCAHNAEQFIQQTIESVLHNNFIDYEYILIDDCSTDKTPLIMSKYANDKHVKLILNEKNVGLASSSNIAIDNARGKYIMRIDADDIFISDHLGAMLYEIKQDSNIAAIYPSYKDMDEFGKVGVHVIGGAIHTHAGCALMDKRILNEIRFKDGLRAWDSLELHKRLIERASVYYYNQPAWYYRQHKNSLSKSDLEERNKIKIEFFNG